MAKPRRWFLRPLLLLIVLAAVAIAVAPVVPLSPLKPAVESKLSATLGRNVTVGSLRLSLFGGPYLLIEGMTAKEDPAFGEGEFLRADQVSANLSLLPLLLRRQVVIEGLTIKAPDLTLIKNENGVWSWTTVGQSLAASNASPASGSTAQAVNWYSLPSNISLLLEAATTANIDELHVENASVRLVDKTEGQQPESFYKNVDLRASISRAATGQGNNSSHAVGELRAQSDEADGSERLKAVMPFDLTLERAGTPELSVQGGLGPGALETRNFSAQSFKSSVNLKGRSVALDQLEMSLYEGTMRGRMELDLSNQRFTTEGKVENLNLDQAIISKLQTPGQITGHINADFKLGGEMRGFQESIPTINGSGRLASSDLFISSFNVSEKVATALQINQIGDMSPGTGIGKLDAEFQMEQGSVTTTNVQIQQLDGLGDATVDQGRLSVASVPVLDYTAAVLLSADATARVKSSSPLLGVVVTLLQNNNRFTVPVIITGDVRNPQIQVDVRRIL